MGIKYIDWYNRIASRSDITGRVTHLTRPQGIDTSSMTFEEINMAAVGNLIKILTDKQINGSTTEKGYIIGNKKAVCFQDVPLYALIQNVEHEKQRRQSNRNEKLRYCGVGLSFVKPTIYHNYGGRPVIYEEKEVAKNFLADSDWWRIVAYDFKYLENNELDIVDWTHEREWRVPGELKFDKYLGIHIILYNPDCTQAFIKNCPKEIIEGISGITTLTSILM